MLETLEAATKEDQREGLSAYPRYRVLTAEIARQHGFPPDAGAAVFAALSPNNGYLGNLRDTNRLLLAVASGGKLGKHLKVSTYGANRSKALRIAFGEPPLSVLSGRKVRSFFTNITHPEDEHTVTVDGHMYNAWHGERKPLMAQRRSITPLLYEEIASDIRQLAHQAGQPPWAVQATLWFT